MLSGEYKLFVIVEVKSLLRPLFQSRMGFYKNDGRCLTVQGNDQNVGVVLGAEILVKQC
jgi:hypothetical protein